MMLRLMIVLALLALTSQTNLVSSDVLFYESFDEQDVFETGKWVKSTHPDYANQDVQVKPSINPIKEWENDKGAYLATAHRRYALGSKFIDPVKTEGKDLVIQYELKLDQNLECGGAYVKLPRHSDDLDISKLDNQTPYVVMFGKSTSV